MIELTYDTREMAELLEDLRVFPEDLKMGTARAINDTLRATRTEMVRLVREDVAVKASAVRKELNIHTAKKNQLHGRIRGESSPGIPLKEFARTKKVPSTKRLKSGGYSPKKGIPVLIRKSKGKMAAKGVFLQRMSSGHVGAFKRVSSMRGNWWQAAQGGPERIREMYGPSPLKILSSDQYDEHIEDFADETMQRRLEYYATMYLEKRGVVR